MAGPEFYCPLTTEPLSEATLKSRRKLLIIGRQHEASRSVPHMAPTLVRVEAHRLGSELRDDTIQDVLRQPGPEASANHLFRWAGARDPHRRSEDPASGCWHRRDEGPTRCRVTAEIAKNAATRSGTRRATSVPTTPPDE